MSDFYPYGGIYSPFGRARRNEPVEIAPVNPLPENAKSDNCGDAGLDGYTVLSRASRMTGERPMINGIPQYEGPKLSEDL